MRYRITVTFDGYEEQAAVVFEEITEALEGSLVTGDVSTLEEVSTLATSVGAA